VQSGFARRRETENANTKGRSATTKTRMNLTRTGAINRYLVMIAPLAFVWRKKMCKWGTDKEIEIDGEKIKVDACIAKEIEYLNKHGVKTISSCCGHNKSGGKFVALPSVLIWNSDRKRAVELGYIPIRRWGGEFNGPSTWKIILKGKKFQGRLSSKMICPDTKDCSRVGCGRCFGGHFKPHEWKKECDLDTPICPSCIAV